MAGQISLQTRQLANRVLEWVRAPSGLASQYLAMLVAGFNDYPEGHLFGCVRQGYVAIGTVSVLLSPCRQVTQHSLDMWVASVLKNGQFSLSAWVKQRTGGFSSLVCFGHGAFESGITTTYLEIGPALPMSCSQRVPRYLSGRRQRSSVVPNPEIP